MKILAIETSCDETSAAVVEDGTKILSNVIASSSAMHEKWGGIVPEVAAREQLKAIIPVIIEALEPIGITQAGGERRGTPKKGSPRGYSWGKALDRTRDVDAVAVTVGPGLIGSLLIGVETAKTIAFVTGKPIIPVNHVLAHMYANFLTTDNSQPVTFPAISLVVSGGHTELFLMTSAKDLKWLGGTIDDAAGEAFDKSARLLGFGSKGGFAIQESASHHSPLTTHNPQPFSLPRPLLHDHTLNFSFSGLKTAIQREWKKSNLNQQHTTDNQQLISAFAYEIQEAITDVLVTKTLRAAAIHHAQSILISGGVASNLRLREKFQQSIKTSNLQHPTSNIQLFVPPVQLCTDNAAYIASYAYFRGKPAHWQTLDAVPDLSVEIQG